MKAARMESRHPDQDPSSQATRIRLWRAMLEDFELSWLKDVSRPTASRIIEMTLRKMHDNHLREEGWRLFLGERAGAR